MKPLTQTTNGYQAAARIYVKGDGVTVCEPNDPAVAFLKYTPGQIVSAKEAEVLVFAPEPIVSEPMPDAEKRAAPVLDTEKRRGKK